MVGLWLAAACLAAVGCRMDMQDQPRYEVYEPSKSFADGQSSRPLVEGTVARGQLRDNALLYTGKAGAGAQGRTTSGSALTAPQTGTAPGGAGSAQPNVQTGGQSGGGQLPADINVRGNAAGGIPGGGGQMLSANPAGGVVRATGAGGAGANVQAGPDVFPFPITAQTLREGRTRYEQFCAMCHGPTGNSDGMIVRRGFQRPPSFHEDRLQEGQSPASHFFDVVTNGWGAMPDYASMIAVEDRWKIIAYVRALQLSRRATLADVPADKRGQLGGTQQQQPATTQGGGGGH